MSDPQVLSWLIQICWERLRAGGEAVSRGWDGWMASLTQSMDMSLSKLREMVKNKEAWYAAVHGVTKNQTWLNNWTTTESTCKMWFHLLFKKKYRRHCRQHFMWSPSYETLEILCWGVPVHCGPRSASSFPGERPVMLAVALLAGKLQLQIWIHIYIVFFSSPSVFCFQFVKLTFW